MNENKKATEKHDELKAIKKELAATKEEFNAVRAQLEAIEVEREDREKKLAGALSLAREYKEDMERMKQRAKDVEETKTKEVAEKTILALLPVLDNLELSLSACKDEQVKKGFDIVKNQFEKVLSSMGAEKIDTKGEFDPQLHESISVLPSPDKKQQNHIAHVLKNGYTYCGKVIRAAQVVVYQ